MENIAQLIKYEGDNTSFIWKHPIEDFNTGTQLIVHESQEAIFFMNGQALDLFGPGRHTLNSQNLPFIGKFFKRPTNDETPFHCEVYFINKTEQMGIKWGTDSKVEYVEPRYNFPIQIGASGEMFLRIEDSRRLLVKVVGTEKGISQQSLAQKFRAVLMTRVKTYLALMIRQQKINIFEIDEQLSHMSGELEKLLKPDFSNYGVSLERFLVTTIVKPEEDRGYQKFKELHFRQYADVAEAQLKQQVGIIEQQTQAQRMVIESQGIAQKRTLEGYSYQQEQGYEVAKRIADNEAVGSFTNIGTGLGLMAGVGGAIGSTVGGMVGQTMGQIKTGKVETAENTPQPTPAPVNAPVPAPTTDSVADTIPCAGCGTVIPRKSKFCPECGSPQKRICANCGTEAVGQAKFCLECGQKL